MNTATLINPNATDAVEVGARKVSLSDGDMRGDVSSQWFKRPADEKFLSLSALYQSVLDREEHSTEARIKNRALEIFAPDPVTKADTHVLKAGMPDGREVDFSHWSFGQAAGLVKAPAGYLRTLPSQLVADNLTWGLQQNRSVETVKTYDAKGTLRAITGPDYGRIFDREVVEAVMRIAGNGIGDTRWKVPGVMDWSTLVYDPDAPITTESTTLFASDRDVFIFLVDDKHPIEIGKLPDGSPDLIFRGFYVTNSEVGSGALKIAAFYLRAVCANRLLWGVEGFEELSIRHTKFAPDRFIESARPALQSFAEGSTGKLLEGVAKAKAAKVASDDDEALEWLQSRNLTKRRAKSVLEAVEREEGTKARTVWDMAQGITALARTDPNTDSRIEQERVAQRMLDRVAA